MAQGRVVVEVLVAEGQAQHALGEQGVDRVGDKVGIAPVDETGGELARQPQRTIQIAQEQDPAVGAKLAAIKTRHHLARTQGLKRKLGLRSVIVKRIGFVYPVILLHTKSLGDRPIRFNLSLGEIFGLEPFPPGSVPTSS